MDGKVIIVTAPSGAGKSTIVRHLIGKEDLQLEFSVSACTRAIREGEKEGSDYYFMTVDTFKAKIDEGEFIEWEEVYKNSYYGTLNSEVNRIWQADRNILFDVDVMGALTLKERFGPQAMSLFIMPPSLDVLRERLEKRGTDSVIALENRLNKAGHEMKFAAKFDETILNDQLEDTLHRAETLVRNFVNQPDAQ